jgi:arylsulfatase A-like enzyme
MSLPEVPADDLDDVPAANRTRTNAKSFKMTERQAREAIAAYYASVTYMDEQVGRLLDTLDRLQLNDNTVVVFISDHGWLLGEHDCWQKMSLFEEACRVPLIIRAPDFESSAGQSSGALVELVDLYPTIVELASLTDQGPEILEGRSLIPLLQNPAADGDRAGWDRTVARTVMSRGKEIHRSARSTRFRYSRYASGEEELYDHENDPHEFDNLAGDPAYAEIKSELGDSLR